MSVVGRWHYKAGVSNLKRPATIDEDVIATKWRAWAQSKLAESVVLITDPGKSEAKLAAMIANTPIGKDRGDYMGHVVILYDTSLSCEAVTAPHLRSAPYRKEHASKLMNAIMSCRKDPEGVCKMTSGDLLVFHDAGKSGNAEHLNKLLVKDKGRFGLVAKAENMMKLQINIYLSEDTLKQRRALTRGVGSLKQLTTLHLYHHANTTIPERGRTEYPGTNLGSVLGPVVYEDWSDSWKLSLNQKRSLYGEHRQAVGGRSDGTEPGDDDDADDDEDCRAAQDDPPVFSQPLVGAGRGHGARQGSAMEPAFWFQFPEKFYMEIISSFWAKKIIDLTPGSGCAAMGALHKQVGYLGLCFNDDHRRLLTDHLIDKVLQLARDERHAMYQPDYQKWWLEQGETTAKKQKVSPLEAAKAEVEAKAKAVAKAGKKVGSTGTEEQLPEPPAKKEATGSLASLLAGITE